MTSHLAPDDHLTETVPQCDAFLREPATDFWGTHLVRCSVSRGLSAFVDYQGQTRRACGATGHSASVVRMYGVMEKEPDWLPEGIR